MDDITNIPKGEPVIMGYPLTGWLMTILITWFLFFRNRRNKSKR